MMYSVERWIDGRWVRESEALPLEKNEFESEAQAQDLIDEMRLHSEWTMAQLRIVPMCRVCKRTESDPIHDPWNTRGVDPIVRTHEFNRVQSAETHL